MNREIRFRIWDNDSYMSKPISIYDIQFGKIQFTRDCVVMQYTGLKDKNGVGIYEGDHFGNPQFPVYFVDGMFCVGDCPLSDYLQGATMEKIEEVKGNIYESK